MVDGVLRHALHLASGGGLEAEAPFLVAALQGGRILLAGDLAIVEYRKRAQSVDPER